MFGYSVWQQRTQWVMNARRTPEHRRTLAGCGSVDRNGSAPRLGTAGVAPDIRTYRLAEP